MAAWVPPKTNQTGIDIETFKKLVARFDSSFAGEAETAFRKAVMICAQAQMRFCDAATEAYAENSVSPQHQAEIAELRQRLEQREKQGAAIADARDQLEREFTAYRYKTEQTEQAHQGETAKLRRDLFKLQMSAGRVGVYCHACETKRRALGVIASFVIGWAWFAHREWFAVIGLHNTVGWHSVKGIGLIVAPLLAVVGHWRWVKFKRKTAWVSWRDNDVYRLLAARWNQLLQRLVMR